jgi:hypothetical protein
VDPADARWPAAGGYQPGELNAATVKKVIVYFYMLYLKI